MPSDALTRARSHLHQSTHAFVQIDKAHRGTHARAPTHKRTHARDGATGAGAPLCVEVRRERCAVAVCERVHPPARSSTAGQLRLRLRARERAPPPPAVRMAPTAPAPDAHAHAHNRKYNTRKQTHAEQHAHTRTRHATRYPGRAGPGRVGRAAPARRRALVEAAGGRRRQLDVGRARPVVAATDPTRPDHREAPLSSAAQPDPAVGPIGGSDRAARRCASDCSHPRARPADLRRNRTGRPGAMPCRPVPCPPPGAMPSRPVRSNH
jgi:hypothetical protein